MTLGLLRAADELSNHLPSARDVVGLVGLTIGVGLLLGLWAPEWFLRRRLDDAGGRRVSDTSSVGPEFAASLVGLRILVLAVLSTLLTVILTGSEAYRGFLTLRFFHPPWLTRALLVVPIAAGLVLIAAAGTIVLAALHGWQRALRGTDGRPAPLWMALLIGSTAGAVAVAAASRPVRLDFVALLPLFLAATLAVWRRSSASPPSDTRVVESRVARPPPWPLLAVGIAWAAVGGALAVAAPPHPVALPSAATALAAVAGVVLGSVLFTRWLTKTRGTGTATVAGLLLAVAVVWGLPASWAGGYALARTTVTAALAAACTVVVGRRLTRAFGRVQPALVAVGIAGAAGFGVGAATGPLARAALDSPTVPVAVSLLLTALAALFWWGTRTASTRRRVTGLTAVGVWLLVLLLMPHASSRGERPSPAVQAAPSVAFGHLTAIASGLHASWRSTAVGAPIVERAADVDLGGPRYDVLILIGPDVERCSAARMVRRCARALLPGGRLAMVEPAPTLTTAAFGVLRDRPDASPQAALLHFRDTEHPAAVLVFGRDAAAWLGTRLPEAGPRAELYLVDDADAVRRVLADSTGR